MRTVQLDRAQHTVQLEDGGRRTEDGYMVADARVARTGIQLYLPSEFDSEVIQEAGLVGRNFVRVYRPEEEVFKKDSLSTYAHRPITIDHPSSGVTADNWKDLAVGQTGDEVVRDGKFVRIPLVLMDAAAIREVEGGLRQLSMGYSCTIEFSDGVSPDGEKYDAIQRNLRMNHLAIVSMARGGSQLRIGDGKEEKSMVDSIKTRSVLVDGLQVETTDAGAVAIEKLQKEINTLGDEKRKMVQDHSADIAKRDAKIDELQKKVLGDAEVQSLVSKRIALVDTARKIDSKFVCDGKTDDEIRRGVVTSKLGDTMRDKDDTYVRVRFDILAEDAEKSDPVREAALRGGAPVVTGDRSASETAYFESTKAMSDAWRPAGQSN